MNTSASDTESNYTAEPSPQDGHSSSAGQHGAFGHRQLSRPVDDRMLAGVASGLARYLGVDVTIVRIVLAVLVFTGPGVPIYLAGWLLIPEEGAEASIASDLVASLENRSR